MYFQIQLAKKAPASKKAAAPKTATTTKATHKKKKGEQVRNFTSENVFSCQTWYVNCGWR